MTPSITHAEFLEFLAGATQQGLNEAARRLVDAADRLTEIGLLDREATEANLQVMVEAMAYWAKLIKAAKADFLAKASTPEGVAEIVALNAEIQADPALASLDQLIGQLVDEGLGDLDLAEEGTIEEVRLTDLPEEVQAELKAGWAKGQKLVELVGVNKTTGATRRLRVRP